MSLYRNETTIDGLRCGVSRIGPGGDYHVIFEREFAGIEQIETINWSHPTLGGDLSVLPVGYGFQVVGIDYAHKLQTYTVRLRVQKQYLGDVTGYQAEIAELNRSLETAQAETGAARQQAAEAQEAAQAARNELESGTAELADAYVEGVNASDE